MCPKEVVRLAEELAETLAHESAGMGLSYPDMLLVVEVALRMLRETAPGRKLGPQLTKQADDIFRLASAHPVEFLN